MRGAPMLPNYHPMTLERAVSHLLLVEPIVYSLLTTYHLPLTTYYLLLTTYVRGRYSGVYEGQLLGLKRHGEGTWRSRGGEVFSGA